MMIVEWNKQAHNQEIYTHLYTVLTPHSNMWKIGVGL